MIASVRGKVLWREEDSLTVETAAGIGMQLQATSRDLGAVTEGEDVFFFTHTAVREDDISLYGFLNRDELSMFRMLIQVKGLGAKTAIGILSVMTVDEIRFAVLSEDKTALKKGPGVGPRLAAQMILDLKDKMDLLESFESALSREETAPAGKGTSSGMTDAASEAVQALTALGFSGTDALKAVKKVMKETPDLSVEDILKAALRFLA